MLTRKLCAATGAAVLSTLSTTAFAADTRSLTIYNQDFAVVRETVPLNLTNGENHITFNDITYHVEPDSVILRDPAGKTSLNILEQNYRADPVSQDLLLSLFEGKTIDFQVTRGDKTEIVQGKIIRSGYVPRSSNLLSNNTNYFYQQQAIASASNQPIIDVDGKLQFALPGIPLFPALPDDSVLKPTLDWTINTDHAGPLNAELGYVTSGITWKADYNIVAPETGDDVDLVGWITIDNETGHTFDNANIKLMAGDVNKVQSVGTGYMVLADAVSATGSTAATVQEKAFDDYHLYTLNRPTTLRDRETKQVEFTAASHVHSKIVYVYDGAQLDNSWTYDNVSNQPTYGTGSNPKIWSMREIVNSEANHLGIPLPKGRMRFYRKEADGQLEFTGENEIDHTPKDETLRIYTGNSFDLTGERKQTDYHVEPFGHTADEGFSIKVRNHKKTPATVHVVEHLYRGRNWTISKNSDPFDKKDARSIEFVITVPPDGQKEVDYSVHYTW